MNEKLEHIYTEVEKLKESGIDDISIRERLMDKGLNMEEIESIISELHSRYQIQKRNSGLKQILYGLLIIAISILFAFATMFASSLFFMCSIIGFVIGCFQIYMGILKQL